MFNLLFLLGILAASIQLSGYLLYAHEAKKDEIVPNLVSWVIWTYGNFLVCASYIMTIIQDGIGDIASKILPVVCSISCIIIFFYIAKFGKWSKVATFEKFILAMDLIITAAWIFSWFNFIPISVIYIHVLLLISAITSFIPIIYGVYQDSSVEKPNPWFLWATAYAVQFGIVLLEKNDFNMFFNIAYPVLYIFLHITMAILSRRKVAIAI